MRRLTTIAVLCAALASTAVLAQVGKQSARDQKAIARARSTLVSQLEPGMPKVTLEYYLRTEAGSGADITWEMNDCGEQTGNAALDSTELPICAEADVKVADGQQLSVIIAVGSVKKGITGKPKIFAISLTQNGSTRPLSRLSQIPLELHITPAS